ncbi:MAG: BON domain-containing protein [Anaerolineae bacterium]|nr:BON domain-containing protein [Anaerolineae bacterium]
MSRVLDIEEDIRTIINSYPPLRESDPYIHIAIDAKGQVTFTGNLRTKVIRRVLIDSTRLVPGVTAINDAALYDDDALLIEIGAIIPPGVYLTAVNGHVVLSGRGPKDPAEVQKLVAAVAGVPGVRGTTTRFYRTAQPQAAAH